MTSSKADRARVQRAALRVGVLVGAASAAVITLGVAILVALLFARGRPADHEPGEGPGGGEGGGGGGGDEVPDADRFVVDVDDILPWVIALGIAGVLVLALVAWLAARRSVRPLTEALRAQRDFVSDASHELRTPLTALTSRIQIAQRRDARGEPLAPTLDELRRDATRLDETLTDMLLTAEGTQARDARADVAPCLSAAVATLGPVAEDHGVTVTSTVTGDPVAAIPGVTLTRLCVALIDNAILHAPEGSTVAVSAEVAVHTGARTVDVRVHDAGAGVAEADRERIFERFARSGETGRRRGFGLGLALVRDSAMRYGGSVVLEQTGPEGSIFLLRLPAC